MADVEEHRGVRVQRAVTEHGERKLLQLSNKLLKFRIRNRFFLHGKIRIQLISDQILYSASNLNLFVSETFRNKENENR